MDANDSLVPTCAFMAKEISFLVDTLGLPYFQRAILGPLFVFFSGGFLD